MFTTAFVTAKVYDVNRLIGEGGVQGLAWGQTPFATWFFFLQKKKCVQGPTELQTGWHHVPPALCIERPPCMKN